MIFPVLGLPLNPGAENPIQNAAMGDSGHNFKLYRNNTSGQISTTEELAVDPNLFKSEGLRDIGGSESEGLIDISNCSSITLFILVFFDTHTIVDFFLRFYDQNLISNLEWKMPALVKTIGTNVQLDVRQAIIRVPVVLDSQFLAIQIPVLNAKFMRIYHKGDSGIATLSYAIIYIGRGWVQGSGLISV